MFKLPRASILDEVAVVPGTDGQKMSKSYGNTIELDLTVDALRARVMEIVTDSASVADPKDPSGSTIVALYRLVASEAEVRQMEAEFRAGGVGYSEFKRRLFEALEAHFTSFRASREALAQRAWRGGQSARGRRRTSSRHRRADYGAGPASRRNRLGHAVPIT